MNYVLVIMLFTGSCALLYAFATVKKSFSLNHTRQKQLLDQFKLFAASNRVLELDAVEVQKFMDDTSDAASYFHSISILNMRNSLQENALLLIHLRDLDRHSYHLRKSKTEIKNSKKETIEWFENAISQMNHLFEPEIKLNPTTIEVLRQVLKLIGRTIRT